MLCVFTRVAAFAACAVVGVAGAAPDSAVPIDREAPAPASIPLSPEPTMRVAYLIPSNRTAQEGAVEVLEELMLTAHDWFLDQMERHGHGSISVRYERGDDGVTPVVHVVHASETDSFLRGDVWGRVNDAAGGAGVPVWQPGEVWLIVPEIHQQQADGTIAGGVALGASFGSGADPGVGMIGSDLLAMAVLGGLTDDRAYHGLVVPAIGPNPLVQDVTFPWFLGTTVSSVVSSFWGAAIHEAIHGFGIGHDFRNDSNFHGNVMGNGHRGFRGTLYPDAYPDEEMRLSPGTALVLSNSVYFTPSEPSLPATRSSGRDVEPSPIGRPVAAPDGGPGVCPCGVSCGVRPEPFPTGAFGLAEREEHGAGYTDRSLPNVQILTSPGALTPQDGLVEISFRATDADGLALAVLYRDGELWDEAPLTGTLAEATLRTEHYTPGQSHTFEVSVYDVHGNRRNVQVNVTPEAGHNRAPLPHVRIAPRTVRAGEPIEIDATRTTDPDGSTARVEYTWDVGGASPVAGGTARTRSFVFTEPGTRLVTVGATDSDGAAAWSAPMGLRVVEGCVPDVAAPTGVLDIFDVLVFLAWFEDGDVRADLAEPYGAFDIFDVLRFLELFEQGCP